MDFGPKQYLCIDYFYIIPSYTAKCDSRYNHSPFASKVAMMCYCIACGMTPIPSQWSHVPADLASQYYLHHN